MRCCHRHPRTIKEEVTCEQKPRATDNAGVGAQTAAVHTTLGSRLPFVPAPEVFADLLSFKVGQILPPY